MPGYGGDRGEQSRPRGELLLDRIGLHVVEQRQRGCGDVIGSLRRATGIFSDVRVVLPLQHRLGEGPERLIERYDVTAWRVLLTPGLKGRRGSLHFDARIEESFGQA